MFDSHAKLSAAEIAFFSPALLCGIYICLRHGFKKQMGWLYVVILCLLRIIGGAAEIAYEANPTSTSLLTTAEVCQSIGLAPLLLCLLGVLTRINDGMVHPAVPNIVLSLLRPVSIIGLILAIIAGTDEDGDSSSSSLKTGRALMKAAVLIFFLFYLALAGCTGITAVRISSALQSERKLMYACIAVLPFLLVRMVYSIAAAFANSGPFYYRDIDVIAQALMQFLMEAIVVTIFLVVGFMAGKPEPAMPAYGNVNTNKGNDVEQGGVDMQSSQAGQRAYNAPTAAPRQQHQRNLADYRPSRMIGNFIRNGRA